MKTYKPLWGAGLVVLGLAVGGCGVIFRFGAPPIHYPSRLQVDRCIFVNSLKLRPASSNYTDHARFGNLLIIRELRGQGYTFYRGTRRLTSVQALKLLGDEYLERAYRKIWTPYAREGRRWVLGGWITIGVGGGLAVVGAAIAASANINYDLDQNKAAKNRFYAGLGLLGAAVFTGIIAPIILRGGYRDEAIADSFKTIFISSSYQGNLETAVRRYNAKVAQRCRGSAPRTSHGRELPPD